MAAPFDKKRIADKIKDAIDQAKGQAGREELTRALEEIYRNLVEEDALHRPNRRKPGPEKRS